MNNSDPFWPGLKPLLDGLYNLLVSSGTYDWCASACDGLSTGAIVGIIVGGVVVVAIIAVVIVKIVKKKKVEGYQNMS